MFVRRKPAWEKHKLTCHFNLSLLENSSVTELKLCLTFTKVFLIGTYLMILNKFVLGLENTGEFLLCGAVILQNRSLVFSKRSVSHIFMLS